MSEFLPESTGGPKIVSEDVTSNLADSPDSKYKGLAKAIFAEAAKDPSILPSQFLAYLQDVYDVGGSKIPFSQIQGAPQFTMKNAPSILTSQSTTSTSLTDLATVGPTLAGLSDGYYLVLFGCNALSSETAYMSVQVNSVSAVEADSCQVAAHTSSLSIMRAVPKTLTNGGNNTIIAKYASEPTGAGATFANRWLSVVRFTNL